MAFFEKRSPFVTVLRRQHGMFFLVCMLTLSGLILPLPVSADDPVWLPAPRLGFNMGVIKKGQCPTGQYVEWYSQRWWGRPWGGRLSYIVDGQTLIFGKIEVVQGLKGMGLGSLLYKHMNLDGITTITSEWREDNLEAFNRAYRNCDDTPGGILAAGQQTPAAKMWRKMGFELSSIHLESGIPIVEYRPILAAPSGMLHGSSVLSRTADAGARLSSPTAITSSLVRRPGPALPRVPRGIRAGMAVDGLLFAFDVADNYNYARNGGMSHLDSALAGTLNAQVSYLTMGAFDFRRLDDTPASMGLELTHSDMSPRQWGGLVDSKTGYHYYMRIGNQPEWSPTSGWECGQAVVDTVTAPLNYIDAIARYGSDFTIDNFSSAPSAAFDENGRFKPHVRPIYGIRCTD